MDALIKLALDTGNTGPQLDTESVVVGLNTVHRERHLIAGAGAAELAAVKNAAPALAAYGLVVRPIASPPIGYRTLSLLNVGISVVIGPCRIVGVEAFNLYADGTFCYLKAYDKASVADNTDTPLKTWPLIPGFPLVLAGLEAAFALGLSIRATTGLLDNDNGAPAANKIVVNLGYRT